MTTGMLKLPDGRVVPQAMNSTVFRMVAFNRFGWRDKIDHTHSGKDGGPIRYQSMSPKEIMMESARIAAQIAEEAEDEQDPNS
jgi:hypothetical protein